MFFFVCVYFVLFCFFLENQFTDPPKKAYLQPNYRWVQSEISLCFNVVT